MTEPVISRLSKCSYLEAKSDSVDLVIHDAIGEGFFGGVSSKSVVEQLNAAKNAKTVRVRLNSPGGAVFDGVAIYNALKSHPGKVTVDVEGLAASAASLIAMAGDEIRMGTGAFMMIHDPWGGTIGNAADHRDTADRLDKIGESAVAIYAARSKKSPSDIRKWMSEELWMTAQEAVDLGFADTLAEEPSKLAAAVGFDLAQFPFRTLPAQLKAIPFRKYPLKEEGAWDGAAAEGHVRKWASSDGSGDASTIDWAKYGWAFTWVDEANRETFGAYSLPHHDVVDGKLQTVRSGVIAAGNAVSGARGGTSIPDADMPAVKTHLEKHYREFSMDPPWESQSAASNRADYEIVIDTSAVEGLTQAVKDAAAIINRAEGCTPPSQQITRATAPTENTTMSEIITTIRALLGLSAGTPESDVSAAVSRLRDLEREVVTLTGAKSTEEAQGAVRAMHAKAAESDRLAAELATVRGERDKQNFDSLIMKGQSDRKLTPAVSKLYADEFAAASSEGKGAGVVERLRGFLNAAPIVVAQAPKQPAINHKGDETAAPVWNGKTYDAMSYSQRAKLKVEDPELWAIMKQDFEARSAA